MRAHPNTRAPEYEEADRQTAPQASAQRTVLLAPRAWQGVTATMCAMSSASVWRRSLSLSWRSI